MEMWLPTRFLAAKIDIDDKDCMTYLSQAVVDPDSLCNITLLCEENNFDNLESLYPFAFANKNANTKTSFLKMTNMTETEFASLYDLTVPTSLGSTIETVDKLVATSYKCASPDICTPLELTVMQWTKSMITMDIPLDFEGNQFLNVDGEICLSKAWKLKDEQNVAFPCSEYTNYKGDFGDISEDTVK